VYCPEISSPGASPAGWILWSTGKEGVEERFGSVGLSRRRLRRAEAPSGGVKEGAFHIFGALAGFERDFIRERTQAGLQASQGLEAEKVVDKSHSQTKRRQRLKRYITIKTTR
jgi:hypothetical protein